MPQGTHALRLCFQKTVPSAGAWVILQITNQNRVLPWKMVSIPFYCTVLRIIPPTPTLSLVGFDTRIRSLNIDHRFLLSPPHRFTGGYLVVSLSLHLLCVHHCTYQRKTDSNKWHSALSCFPFKKDRLSENWSFHVSHRFGNASSLKSLEIMTLRIFSMARAENALR